jgi:hypothetical protein
VIISYVYGKILIAGTEDNLHWSLVSSISLLVFEINQGGFWVYFQTFVFNPGLQKTVMVKKKQRKILT